MLCYPSRMDTDTGTNETAMPTPPEQPTTPLLCVSDAHAAIAFYASVLGATYLSKFLAADGEQLEHAHGVADVHAGSIQFYLVSDFGKGKDAVAALPQGSDRGPVGVYCNCPNADFMMTRFQLAGAKIIMPAEDTAWGTRMGKVVDPFGIGTCDISIRIYRYSCVTYVFFLLTLTFDTW